LRSYDVEYAAGNHQEKPTFFHRVNSGQSKINKFVLIK